MQSSLKFIPILLLTIGALPATAAITTTGVYHVQVDGTFAASNLAAGATAFAPNIEDGCCGGDAGPPQPTGYGGIHTTTGANDLAYGNTGAWLAGSVNSYVGLNLGSMQTVSSIAFGRDNNTVYADRSAGTATLQYTTDPAPSLATGSWTTIGSMTFSANTFYDANRHRFDFAPVNATGVRLVMDTPGRGVDEFEVYSSTIAPILTHGNSIIQNETTNAQGLSNTGNPITEPAPGEGHYRYTTSPDPRSFTWTPGFSGEHVKVEASWGVSFNHTRDVDYFFDPDGPGGPLAEIALKQDVTQLAGNNQLATVDPNNGFGGWSGFFEIGRGLEITPLSVFRVTGTGGATPQALSSAVWQFTAVPEPGSAALLAIGAFSISCFRRNSRRRRIQ